MLDADLTQHFVLFPTDWLPTRKGNNRHRFYPKFSVKSDSFFTMDWDESTPISSFNSPHPSEVCKSQIALRSLLESTDSNPKSVICLSKHVWAVHWAFEKRLMQLIAEANEIDLSSREVFRSISNILTPFWNWNEELMILYGTVAVLKDELATKYFTPCWRDSIYQARKTLEFIKTKNLAFSRTLLDNVLQIDRGVAVCVSMYGIVTETFEEIDKQLHLIEKRGLFSGFSLIISR